MGLLGMRGSPYWIAAAWAVHPLWDVVLHFIGPGHAFAPVTYTIPCLTYDVAVAAIYAVQLVVMRRGTVPRGVTAAVRA